jgi:hypothetical protein
MVKPSMVAVGLALLALAAGLGSAPPVLSRPQTSVDPKTLNAEDCKVFAPLGRAMLGWGKTPPSAVQFPIFYRPQGGGYVEQCPWKALGVTPLPLPAFPDLKNVNFFTTPTYSPDGRVASVSFVVHRNNGLHVFVSQKDCKLEKTGKAWRFVACTQGPIT